MLFVLILDGGKAHATATTTYTITQTIIPTVMSLKSGYCGMCGVGDGVGVFGRKFLSKLL